MQATMICVIFQEALREVSELEGPTSEDENLNLRVRLNTLVAIWWISFQEIPSLTPCISTVGQALVYIQLTCKYYS